MRTKIEVDIELLEKLVKNYCSLSHEKLISTTRSFPVLHDNPISIKTDYSKDVDLEYLEYLLENYDAVSFGNREDILNILKIYLEIYNAYGSLNENYIKIIKYRRKIIELNNELIKSLDDDDEKIGIELLNDVIISIEKLLTFTVKNEVI